MLSTTSRLRRRTPAFLAFLALLALVASTFFGSAASARADDASVTGGISGTVTDGSGAAFTGDREVFIEIRDLDGQFRKSGIASATDDSWSAFGLDDGSYLVYVSTQGLTTTRDDEGGYYVAHGHPSSDPADATTVVVANGAVTTGIDFVLHARPHITGTVQDVNGNPVGGASVEVWNSDGMLSSNTTADDGSYNIRAFAPYTGLTVHIVPAGDSLLPQWYKGAITQAAATPFDTHFDTNTALDTVRLKSSSTISGTVTDADHHGIAGITVQAVNSNDPTVGYGAQTGDDGSYTVTGLVNGTYTVSFYGDHFGNQTYNQTTDPDGSTPVILTDAAPNASGIDAQLTATGSISGTVSGTDGPLEGVYALATNVDNPDLSYGAWVTDESGEYSIDQLPNADYRVSFSLADDTSYYVADTLQSTVSVDVATEDVTDVDHTLTYGGAVSGNVTLGSKSYSDVTVTVKKNGDWVKYVGVKDDGSYVASGLAAGTYTLDFEPSDSAYAGNTATVTVVAGTTKTGVNGVVRKSVVQADLYVKAKRTDSITVGETLSVATHAHSVSIPSKVTSTYRWVRIDQDTDTQTTVGTKSTYKTVNADAGFRLGVWVTQSATGYASALQFYVNPEPASGAKFTKSPKLTLSGTLATGNTVKAKLTGSWSPAPTEVQYFWSMNGLRVPASWSRTDGTMYLGWDDIGGGNPYDSGNPPKKDSDPRLSVKGDVDYPEDASNDPGDPNSHDYPFTLSQLLQPQWNGQRLTLEACAIRGDYYDASCKTVTVHIAHDLIKRVIPVISKDGGVWTANAGVWHSTTYVKGTVALKYQWMRDGSPIAGASSKTYSPTSADSGHLVTVTVTGSAKGFTTAKTYSLNTALAP